MPIYLPVRRPLLAKPPVGCVINQAHPLTHGLAAGWLFNEGAGLTAFDLLQVSNGTFSGAGKPYWTSGFSGSSSNFNGTNDLVTVGANSSLNLSGPMTVSTRIFYPTGGSTGPVIIDCNSSGTVGLFGLVLAQNTNILSWKQGTFSGNSSNTGQKISTGKWLHVVATRSDGSSSAVITFYVNGQQNGTVTVNIAPGAQAGVFLGNNGPSGGNFYKGQIDSILIWNYVLTTDQITQLYVDPYCFMKQPRQGILKQKKQVVVTTSGNAIWFGAIA